MSVDSFMRKIIGASDEEFDRSARIIRLATYNAERGRGLIHSKAWMEFMAEEQAWWNGEGQYQDSNPASRQE